MGTLSARSRRVLARRVTRSATGTAALGLRLGRLLAPGDVVALLGELGSGKTEFARAVCEGAGVPPGEVTSPSFAIVATYRGRFPVHHADLYRIADFDELYATGLLDLLDGEGALLIEWADRVAGAMPPERLEIRFKHDPVRPHVRHLRLLGMGGRHAALASALALKRSSASPRRKTTRRRHARPSRPRQRSPRPRS